MQLANVFGFCVIQIKPQLEALLNLPRTALVKEIRLTEDLLDIFIRYQIPSDLLTYEGDADLPVLAQIAEVKAAVTAVMGLINREKARSLDEQIEAARARLLQLQQSPLPVYEEPRAPPVSYSRNSSSSSILLQATLARRGLADDDASSDDEDDDGSWGDRDEEEEAPRRLASAGLCGLEEAEAMTMSRAEDICDTKAVARDEFLDDLQQQAPSNAPPEPPTAQPEPPTDQQQQEHVVEPQDQVLPVPVVREERDWTEIPGTLEQKYELIPGLDEAVRPVIIKAGDQWNLSRRRAPDLLSPVTSTLLSADDQRLEQQRAFDLLDALTRSGGLAVSEAEVHILVGCSHTFEKSVVETVVQDNINAIEQIERSLLIMASATFEQPAQLLVRPKRLSQVMAASPMLDSLCSPPSH
jgi:hypothetical protein